MPHSRDDWLTRIKAVEREFSAMRQAADRFLAELRRDPAILRRDTAPRDAERASATLEGTYVVRLFSEFETCLRTFWTTARPTHPRASDLIDGIAAMRHIPTDAIDDTHRVRRYRNSLVHDRDDPVEAVAMSDCRRFVCIYMSRLPVEW